MKYESGKGNKMSIRNKVTNKVTNTVGNRVLNIEEIKEKVIYQ